MCPSFRPCLPRKAIAALTAALSLMTPVANDATGLARARSIQGSRSAWDFLPIIGGNAALVSRASTRSGRRSSMAATVTVSDFESVFRLMVISRAMVLAEGIRWRLWASVLFRLPAACGPLCDDDPQRAAGTLAFRGAATALRRCDG